MARFTPILACETTAAQLLDMKPAEFRAAVEAGHLPRGRELVPGLVRWPVEDLKRIASGDAIEGGGIQW
ncbi:hypothetical protein GVY41_09065 [Frigidibacter albus]|uniref:DNA-binding protein n=1 Tax=Frigidibacter albus TaxID=1465486 RepID=A0A6L8VI78_9RHOB|nr:hypothetical protein [Frigidibacter albus]MZQ89242.1 hypothetical protein [Frigidibacter albus]NBE31148.1 hypothetical protein [Frigidibacter albus]GGH53132.1 hypothetical protein GCM10011341_18310 [Frigidibacter albus]